MRAIKTEEQTTPICPWCGWEHDESDKDIVDGKQRMSGVIEFIENKFPDIHGNYFSDLSNQAQHAFSKHQLLSYCELPEFSTDEAVLKQFLKINFAGVPQSLEHIKYVEGLLK